jgi:hypothetical protein
VEKQWYLSRGDRRLGPFAIGKLRQLAAAGKLAKEDRLCELGTLEWRMAADVEELFPKPAPVAIVAAAPVETVVRSPSAMQTQFAGEAINARLDEYLKWRWLRCVILLPFSLAAMAVGVYAMIQVPDRGLSQLGKFIRMAVPMSHIGLPMGAAIGILLWRRYRECAFGMMLGWGIAAAVPMSLAFVPLPWLFDSQGLHEAAGAYAVGAFLAPAVVAIGFVVLLLGSLYGASPIRSLLPESDSSAWIVMSSALLLGVYGFGGLIASIQLLQSPWPIIAFALMTASPLALIFDWRSLMRSEPRMPTSSPTRSLLWFNLLLWGGAFVLATYFTAEIGGHRLVNLSRTLSLYAFLSFSSACLATAILCADGVLSIAVAGWRLNRPFHASREAEECEREFEELARSM